MTDNELLLAISNMMDEKLKSNLAPLENRMDRIENRIGRIETRIDKIETRMGEIETRMDKIETRVVKIENRAVKIENRVVKIELTLENDIHQRLNTIESCYTDTYNRYKDYADRMQGAFCDIDIIKKVVSEHSEKFQMIS